MCTWTEIGIFRWVVELEANLASDPSLSAEGTKSEEGAEGLPLASSSHGAGRAVRRIQVMREVTKGEGYIRRLLLLDTLSSSLWRLATSSCSPWIGTIRDTGEGTRAS